MHWNDSIYWIFLDFSKKHRVTHDTISCDGPFSINLTISWNIHMEIFPVGNTMAPTLMHQWLICWKKFYVRILRERVGGWFRASCGRSQIWLNCEICATSIDLDIHIIPTTTWSIPRICVMFHCHKAIIRIYENAPWYT